MVAPARILVLLEDESIPSPVRTCGPVAIEYFDGPDPARFLGKTSRHTFEYLTRHDDLAGVLKARRPELVFNLCDQGFENDPQMELHIPALCEVLGIPYTGAPPKCLALAFDKIAASAVARSVGISTPREVYQEEPTVGSNAMDLEYPLLVKPNFADGSFGVFRDSLVRNVDELRAYLTRVAPFALGPLLFQEYLPGTEYCVVAVGNVGNLTVLPVLEKDYSAFGADYPPITAFDVKWWSKGEPFPYELDLRPAKLSPDAHALLERHAARLFARFECRDYAKFDFRTGTDGVIRLIDVNPNFDLFSDSLAMMCELAGRTHAALIDSILDGALLRGQPSSAGSDSGVNQSGPASSGSPL